MPLITTRRFMQTAASLCAGLFLVACGKQEPPPVAKAAPAPAAAAPARVYVVGTDAA